MQAADDAAEAEWHDVGDVPKLAFDHKLVVRECFQHACKLDACSATARAALHKGIEKLAGDWRQ